MAKRHIATALMLALVLAACAGSTSTPGPITSAETSSASTSTATPAVTSTSTPLAPTSSAGSNPTATVQQPTPKPTTTGSLAWAERSDVAVGPGAREDHTWTVSDDGTVAYLFGGRGAAGTLLGDLWQFDVQTDTWTELHPTGDAPPARFGHTATWVRDVGLVVWSGQGARFFGDIWRYDPAENAWAELPSAGAVPEARYGSCASLGPDGELWISHGFTADDGRFADTRSYNFSTGQWTDRTPTAGDLPVERCLHDCFWSEGGELILYGGQTTGVKALGDLWALDPTEGWTRAPDPSAKARNLYALARGADSTVLFGGGALDGGYLGDTWVVDDARAFERVRDSEEGPPARSSATLIYSAPRDRYLLFGGMNGDGVLADLWELSSTT